MNLHDLDFSHLTNRTGRNLLPEAFSGRDFCHDKVLISQIELLHRQAAEYLATPTPVLTYKDFTEYGRSGIRDRYNDNYYDRRGRLMVFAILAWLEPQEDTWLDALSEIVWHICSEPWWAVPAHLINARPMPVQPEQYPDHLDLFSAETASALAETLVLLGDRLPADLRGLIRHNIQRRVFTPWLDRERPFFFEKFPNNWASVCASGIGIAALYLLESGDMLDRLLKRSMECIEVYLSSFGGDGVCLEGAGYFSYGFGMFTCFADLLEKRSEGKINLFALSDKAEKIAASQNWFYLSGKSVVNFADSRDTVKCRLGISHYLAKKTGCGIPPVSETILEDTCYRFCIGLRDLIWVETKEAPASEYNATWMEDAQWFFARGDRTALAAKGGQNGQSHGHLDCGSFILFSQGESCVCDPGSGQYNAKYFSPRRFEFLVTGSLGHNVPIVNGVPQHYGPECSPNGIQVDTAGTVKTFSLDISACYGEEAGLTRLQRNFSYDPSGNVLTLTDEAELSAPGILCENFCAREEIILSVGTALFPRNGKTILLTFDEEELLPEVLHETYLNMDNESCDLWMLHLTTRAAREKQVVTLRFHCPSEVSSH